MVKQMLKGMFACHRLEQYHIKLILIEPLGGGTALIYFL